MSKTRLAQLALLALVACDKHSSKAEPPPEPDIAAMVDAALAAAVGDPDAMLEGAREQFGKQFSCPDDRIRAKRRTDLEIATTATSATPPDEVKADPERLAKWQADHAMEQAASSKRASERQRFELDGCGHSELLDCRPHHGPNGAVYPNWADCHEMRRKP